MEKIFTKKSSESYLNLELYFIEGLASRLEKIGKNLAYSESGLISHYRIAYGEVCTLYDFIQASLNCDIRDIKKIDMYLEISNKISHYDVILATKYLRKSLRFCLRIIKLNNLLFGKRTKSLSFKKFVEGEAGIKIDRLRAT